MVHFPLGSYFVQKLSVLFFCQGHCQRGRIIHTEMRGKGREKGKERGVRRGVEEEEEEEGKKEGEEERQGQGDRRESDLYFFPSNEPFQQPCHPSYHRHGFYYLYHPPVVIP